MNHLTVAAMAVAVLSPGLASAELRAGTALADVTPTEWPLHPRGSFAPRPVSSAHDPLTVRCLVLDDGAKKIAFALVDSCMVHRDILDPAKKAASDATGIPSENMLISATHTHSAPFANARYGTPQELAYQKVLSEGIVSAISQATKDARPALAGWSSANVPDEVFNRRWYLKPGTMPVNPFGSDQDQVKMNPGRGKDNLVKPAGPVDPELSVLYLTDAKKKPLSVYANYALHYVGSTEGKMSADYFGEFARLMPVRLGGPAKGFVAMMTNGTSGDINNVNFRNPRPRRAPFEQIHAVATKSADAATLAIRGIDELSGEVKLDMRQREIELKHRAPTTDEIAWAKKVIETPSEAEKALPRHAKTYAMRTLNLSKLPPTTKVVVQAVRIGDLAICALPFEVLVEIGLELKEKSPAGDTFVVELANGGYGYLPTPRQHDLGGYETWMGTNKVQKDASEILVWNLLEMLGELFPE